MNKHYFYSKLIQESTTLDVQMARHLEPGERTKRPVQLPWPRSTEGRCPRRDTQRPTWMVMVPFSASVCKWISISGSVRPSDSSLWRSFSRASLALETSSRMNTCGRRKKVQVPQAVLVSSRSVYSKLGEKCQSILRVLTIKTSHFSQRRFLQGRSQND